MAQLTPDMSPFQIGTTGKFENNHFEILGLQRLSYDGGKWNEWYVMMDNGQQGWLGEAQGFLMMSFPVPDASIPDIGNLSAGGFVELQKKKFEIEDIKKVFCEGGLGELPVMSEKGRLFLTVDLIGENETFANIVVDGKDQHLYLGRYADFDELHFSNLREIDGW